MKTMALVCAAMVTFTAGGFGMQMAGWFSRTQGRAESRQLLLTDPLQTDVVTHYRHNLGTTVHLLPIYR
jgi:hypothetical protein